MKASLLLFACFAYSIALAQTATIDDNKLLVPNAVQFKSGSAELLPESEAALKSVKEFLAQKTYVTLLRVEGHVASGTPQAQALSEQRALAVTKWLVNDGVDCKRLVATGFGDTKPVVANNSAAKDQNTRIVFALAGLRGHLIGSMPADGGGKTAGNVCQ